MPRLSAFTVHRATILVLTSSRSGFWHPRPSCYSPGQTCQSTHLTRSFDLPKAQPTTVGHSGVGSNAHLTCALFNRMADLKPTKVPYRGNAPLMRTSPQETSTFPATKSSRSQARLLAGTSMVSQSQGRRGRPSCPEFRHSRRLDFPILTPTPGQHGSRRTTCLWMSYPEFIAPMQLP